MIGAEAVEDWADCGMTLPMTQEYDPAKDDPRALRAVLDAAHARGMKVIVCDRRGYAWCSTKPDALDVFRRDYAAAVAQFGDHPAVFGFHLGDEPDHTVFDNACAAVRIASETAPRFVPFLNLLPKHEGFEPRVGFDSWPAYLDAYCEKAKPPFLCYDCYSQMDEGSDKGVDLYFENLRDFRQAGERHGIPYWTTLISVGHFLYRCPTEDDFRWQLHTAVAHGARGILWFFLYMRYPHSNYRVPPIDEHWQRTENFPRLARVQKTFLKWHAALMLRLRLQRVVHTGRAYGGHELFAGTERVSSFTSQEPHVVTEWKDESGRDYVSVVNNSPRRPAHVALQFRGARTAVHRVDWMGQEKPHACKPREDAVSTWFFTAPGQMEVFRLDRPA
jgi:hypothetical protein